MVEIDASVTRGAFALLTWYAFNIFTVVLNKWLYEMIQFRYPLTLTAVHMFVCSMGSFIALRLFKVVPLVPVENQKIVSRILPLGAIFCLNIVLGNISLRWIPVSFMQTVKSSVPAFTVALQAMPPLNQYASQLTYISLIPVVGGVALAAFTEVNFQIIGFVAAIVASLTTAIQSIMSGVLLTGSLRLDSVNMVYYMAPISFVLILPIALISEWESLVNDYNWDENSPSKVATLLGISGLVAYLLNISVFFAIKSTSPLTFTVFGNLKVVVVIIISVMIFENEITIWNGVGCAIAIAGILWYNAIEYQVKQAKNRAALLAVEQKPLMNSQTDVEITIDSSAKKRTDD